MPRKAKEDKHDDVYAWPADMIGGDEVPKMFQQIRNAHCPKADAPKIVLRIEGEPADWKTKVAAVPKAICSVMSWARKLVIVDWTWWLAAEDAERLREVHTVLARLSGEKPIEIYPSVAKTRGISIEDRLQLALPGLEPMGEPSPIEKGPRVMSEAAIDEIDKAATGRQTVVTAEAATA